MEQNMKKGRVKGTVLFTVVAVMMVLVVFLMSTLILTTSAQRRTYYTYYETQAQFAANAALETLQNSVYADPTFFNWMAENAKKIGQSVTLDVNFENTDIPISQTKTVGSQTVKYVTCEIERLNDDYYWDEKNVEIVRRRTWRISATALVGRGLQAAESVQAFVVYEPVREKKPNPNNNGIQWTGPSDGSEGTEGAGVFASTFSNTSGNVSVLGPLCALGTAPVGRMKYDTAGSTTFSGNNANYASGFTQTNNINFNTQRAFIFQDIYEGAVIYGNLYINNTTRLQSTLKTEPGQYNHMPYLYVDGMLDVSGGDIYVGSNQYGLPSNVETEQRMNLYAGAMKSNNRGIWVNGDIFLYERELESTFTGAGMTHLTTFVEQNIEKANYGHTGYAGGDLICDNKKMSFQGNAITVGGDFIMTNADSTLEFALQSHDVTIGGAMISLGKVIFNTPNKKNLTVKGGIYVDPANVTILQDININGVQFTNQDTVDVIATKLVQACEYASGAQASRDLDGDGRVTGTDLHENTYNNAVVESLGAMSFIYKDGTAKTEQYTSLVSEMLNCEQTYTDNDGNQKKVSVGLFPFCSRLDEIFFSYIRWDLAALTMAEAEQKMNNDELIKESKACGHIWAVKEKTDGSTTIWVPYTSSLNNDKHAFIEEIETGDNAMKPYESTPDDPSEVADMPTETLAANILKTDPVYYYHDANGQEVNSTYNSVYIDNSKIIDSANWSGGTFFIDPSTHGYSAEKPLVIYLKGSFNGELRFLVNNTYDYSHVNDDNTKGEYYADLGTYTDRAQVIFYFDETFWAQKCFIYSTGSYNAVNSGKIDYVANPYYPGTTEWATLSGAEKYKFEYIPNATIYATEGKSYELQNNSFLSAFVISPNASLNINTSGTSLTPTYREEHSSIPFTSVNATIIGIGGFILDDFYVKNEAVLLYATDGNRPGVFSGDMKPDSVVEDDGDYIINDYKTPA